MGIDKYYQGLKFQENKKFLSTPQLRGIKSNRSQDLKVKPN